MKPKAAINVNGEEIAMEGFYRAYHEKAGLVFCIDTNNKVLEIQNLNEDKIANVFSKDVSVVVLPSHTVKVTSFFFTDPDFGFVLKDKNPTRYADEDVEETKDSDYEDCHD